MNKKTNIFLLALTFIYLLFSCTDTTPVEDTNVVVKGDTTVVIGDTTVVIGDTTKVTNESPLNKELKGVYNGAWLYSHFPKDTIPKLFIDSTMILRKGTPSTFIIDSISLTNLKDYKGESNSIKNDTLKYIKRISVYQGITLYIIRSKKTIWTISQYSHNVPFGTLYDHCFYSLK